MSNVNFHGQIMASLFDHANEGWAWIDPCFFQFKDIVKITNEKTKKSICIELLPADFNFKVKYNAQSNTKNLPENLGYLVLSGHYRSALGINSTQISVELKISKSNFLAIKLWYQIRACLEHPQLNVRLSMQLALVGLFLGFLSLKNEIQELLGRIFQIIKIHTLL